MIVGKKHCSLERRKERDEEREQRGQEKDEGAEEHESANVQQSECKPTYCHGSGTHKYIPTPVSFTLLNCEYFLHLSLYHTGRLKRRETSRVLYSGFSVSACLCDL